VVAICISHCAWPKCFEQLFFACHWPLATVGSSDEVSGEVVVVKSLSYILLLMVLGTTVRLGTFFHTGVCFLFVFAFPCLVLYVAS
jgi:hypothetical protein